MKYWMLVVSGIVFALLLGACAPTNATVAPARPTTAVPEMTAATEPAATDMKPAGPTNVSAGQSSVGLVLVDSKSLPLYIFKADTQGSGVSTCYEDDGCSANWPALLTEGEPIAGKGIDATLLGTITRDDGATQVTYNGWPLYHYYQDTMPGDQYGESQNQFGGLWTWITPTGETLQMTQ